MQSRSHNICYLLFSPGNSGHANAPQYYVVHTLPVLFGRYLCGSVTAIDLKPKQVRSLAKNGCMKYDLLFNPSKTKRRLLYLKTQFVPRCKHFSSRLYKPIILCCKWHKPLFVLR